MAEIVNLNRARKDRTRVEEKARAAENRVKHGRTKAETSKSKAERDLADRSLDAHRRDDD